MTNISYVHGPGRIPANEMADRGKEVASLAKSYIPYLGMTEGEMNLVILREQLKVFAAAYPDYPEYREGIRMVDNALFQGVSSGINFVGIIPDNLQYVARVINDARYNTQTAGGELFSVRPKMSGIHIGDDIIPISDKDCRWLAAVQMNRKYNPNNVSTWLTATQWENHPVQSAGYREEFKQLLADCEFKRHVERLLNEKLEGSAHHMLYKSIDSGYGRVGGTTLALKRILHIAGIESLGNVTGVSPAIMSNWTELGVLRKNASDGIGPIGSVESGFAVASGGNAEYQKYLKYKADKQRPRISAIDPETLKVLISACVAALTIAASIYFDIQKQKAGAMAAAQGFGTNAYTPEYGDLITQQAGGSDNTLLYVAAAAGAFLLLNDEN